MSWGDPSAAVHLLDDPRGQPGWAGQVRRHAHLRPDALALRSGADSRTYGELDADVDRLTAVFAAVGVGAGDRVVLLMGNSIEMIEVLLATLRVGAIAVPLNFRLVADEVRYLVGHSEPSLLVTDVERAGVARDVRASISVDLACLVRRDAPVGHASDVAGPGARWLDEAVGHAVGPPVETSYSVESPAFIMYTSGTTGRPKGAVLSHLNLFCQALHYIVSGRSTDDQAVTVVSVPIFHISAIGALVPSMTIGGTCVIMPSVPFDAGHLIDVVEAEGVTDMFLVPTQWQAVCALPDLASRRLGLQVLAWGASPTTTAILEAMGRSFPDARIVAMFGQTEMAPVTCALSAGDSVRKLGSVGKPVALVNIRIVDDEMRDVPEGDVGEIVYRGLNCMAGYWRDPEATAAAFAGGWFHSGDLVRRDDEGFLYVVDRKKDMIVTGGENVYCAEVELVLATHPAIREAAIVGRPHPQWVETPVAYVVPADAARPPDPAEVIEWCRSTMAGYKRPSAVIVVDELPRNASGKVLKHELRADALARSALTAEREATGPQG